MGGLPRRTTALTSLTQEHAAYVVVDAGGSLSPRELTDLDGARKKAQVVATVFGRDGMDAIAVSDRDWQLGRPFIDGLAKEHGLSVIAANLECAGERPYPRSKVVERGGMRVGIVGITGGIVPGCTVAEPIAALTAALAELPEDVDLTVALVPAGRIIARQLTDVDVDLAVVTGSAQRLSIGRTLPVASTGRGKALGAVVLEGSEGARGIFSEDKLSEMKAELARRDQALRGAQEAVDQSAEPSRTLTRRLGFAEKQRDAAKVDLETYGDGRGSWRARMADVPLDDAVADHAETRALVDQVLAAIDARAGAPVPDDAPHLVAGHGAYAGSDACIACHPAEHAQWASTPHATAWETLRDDNHGRDESCVGCHTTGWKQSGGPSDVAAISSLRSVQCEACHGPSRAHLRNPVKSKPVRDPDLSTCTACHDGERDGGRFEPQSYRARVVHGE